MVDALEALSEHATFTRLLGTYARASATSPSSDDLRRLEVL
jgi:hypothetical protein